MWPTAGHITRQLAAGRPQAAPALLLYRFPLPCCYSRYSWPPLMPRVRASPARSLLLPVSTCHATRTMPFRGCLRAWGGTRIVQSGCVPCSSWQVRVGGGHAHDYKPTHMHTPIHPCASKHAHRHALPLLRIWFLVGARRLCQTVSRVIQPSHFCRLGQSRLLRQLRIELVSCTTPWSRCCAVQACIAPACG